MSHTTIRNSNLFCHNCGGEQIITYPINPEMFSAMAKAFEKIHKNCKKTWVQPEVDQSLREEQKANEWLATGERGTSSETIFEVITGKKITKYGKSHPYDPDDFRRCYLLLKAVPEWKNKLHLLKSESKTWANLVDNWDKLTEMLEEQLKTKKANGMYEFMENLGC